MKKALKPVRTKTPAAAKKLLAKLAMPKKPLARPKQPQGGAALAETLAQLSRATDKLARAADKLAEAATRLSAAAQKQHQSTEAPHQSGLDAIAKRESEASDPAAQPDRAKRTRPAWTATVALQLLQRHLAALDLGASLTSASSRHCSPSFEGTHAQGTRTGLHAWKR
jgi:hypothetical protein